MFKHYNSSTPESFFKENEENRNNIYAADAACVRILIAAYNYAAEYYETIVDKNFNCHDTIKDVTIVNARKQKKKEIIKAAFEGRLKDVFPDLTMSYKRKVLDDFCGYVVEDIHHPKELVEGLRRCILYHDKPFWHGLYYNRIYVFDEREQTRLAYFESSTPQSCFEEPEFHPSRRIVEAAMYAFENRESILNKYWSGHYEIYEEGHEFAGMRKWVPDSRYNKLDSYTRRDIIEDAFEGHSGENTNISDNRRLRAIKQFCEAVATELNDQTIADDLYEFIKNLRRIDDLLDRWLYRDSIWPYLSY